MNRAVIYKRKEKSSTIWFVVTTHELSCYDLKYFRFYRLRHGQ